MKKVSLIIFLIIGFYSTGEAQEFKSFSAIFTPIFVGQEKNQLAPMSQHLEREESWFSYNLSSDEDTEAFFTIDLKKIPVKQFAGFPVSRIECIYNYEENEPRQILNQFTVFLKIDKIEDYYKIRNTLFDTFGESLDASIVVDVNPGFLIEDYDLGSYPNLWNNEESGTMTFSDSRCIKGKDGQIYVPIIFW